MGLKKCWLVVIRQVVKFQFHNFTAPILFLVYIQTASINTARQVKCSVDILPSWNIISYFLLLLKGITKPFLSQNINPSSIPSSSVLPESCSRTYNNIPDTTLNIWLHVSWEKRWNEGWNARHILITIFFAYNLSQHGILLFSLTT